MKHKKQSHSKAVEINDFNIKDIEIIIYLILFLLLWLLFHILGRILDIDFLIL